MKGESDMADFSFWCPTIGPEALVVTARDRQYGARLKIQNMN